VIEDADVHLSILRMIAGQAGFATTGVNSVEAASAMLRERNFDCITLDLSLGERSGTEILKLLADLKCRTPILIISASDDHTRDVTGYAGQILGLKVHPPLPKPIDVRALRQTLKQIADGAERQRLEQAGSPRSKPAHTTSDCSEV
jgi:DNA-binding response OmpR family regulator